MNSGTTRGARLSVLAWPAFSNVNENPYQARLYEAMAADADVTDLILGKSQVLSLLKRRFDVFHIHWIEKLFWGATTARAVRRYCLLMTLIVVLKLRGTIFIWTVHDPWPHEMASTTRMQRGLMRALAKSYEAVLSRSFDGLIFLSRTGIEETARRFPALARAPKAIVPHPHYRGAYPNTVSREEARRTLDLPDHCICFLMAGSLRPYKNADGLITAFRGLACPGARLVVAGVADTADYGDRLKTLAEPDGRIVLQLGFVKTDAFQVLFNACDVFVVPFRTVTNSGSALLALSFDRPVAVPSFPVFQELQDLVGPDWVYLFEGELTAEILADIGRWASTPRTAARPPLDALEWDRLAAETVAFYRSVMGQRSHGRPAREGQAL